MKNFIITSAVCIAMILSSASSMAQQITIVSGKVLNLPEGEKKPRPFPMGETVRIFAFNTVASARDALKALETGGGGTLLFDADAVAGGELGYIQKENGYRPAKGGYTGFTGGLQFKYRLWGDVSLFAEPRTSLASYSLKTNEKEEGRYVAKKFTDNLYSINIGIEIQRTDEENRMARSLNRDLFKPSFFVSGAIGFSVPIQMKRYEPKRYFDYMATISAGRIFTPLSSLRLAADYGPLSTDRKGKTLEYDMASGSLDYMLNLTNLMTGYDPERKYDVQLFAGIVASMRMKHENRFFIGGEAGLQTSYRVGRRFKVFLEPKIRIYGKELLIQDNVQGSDIMMSLNAGTSFSF